MNALCASRLQFKNMYEKTHRSVCMNQNTKHPFGLMQNDKKKIAFSLIVVNSMTKNLLLNPKDQ